MAIIAFAGLLAASAMTGGFDGIRLRSATSEIAAQLPSPVRRPWPPASARISPSTRMRTNGARRKDRHGTLAKQLGIEFYGAREVQPSARRRHRLFPRRRLTGGRIRLRKHAARDIDVAWLTGEVKVTRGGASREPEPEREPGTRTTDGGEGTLSAIRRMRSTPVPRSPFPAINPATR